MLYLLIEKLELSYKLVYRVSLASSAGDVSHSDSIKTFFGAPLPGNTSPW